MRVSEIILNEWKILSERGDQAEIVSQSGLSKYKVSLAIGYGKCDEETFKAVAVFYETKKLRQQNLINDKLPY